MSQSTQNIIDILSGTMCYPTSSTIVSDVGQIIDSSYSDHINFDEGRIIMACIKICVAMIIFLYIEKDFFIHIVIDM